jgi:ATP-dependent DNA helicase RecG
MLVDKITSKEQLIKVLADELDDWLHGHEVVSIEPLDSHESYSVMVRFALSRPDGQSQRLRDALSIERLKEGHLSSFRNPDMANYLNRRGFMEMTGRGSVLIQEACRQSGLPEPQWEADESGVTLTFRAKGDEPQLISKEKGREKSKEKSKEKILAYLSANPGATTDELVEITGLSTSGVEKNIRELKASGRLKRVGADKGGHWEVIE